jgi:16S rRNA (cytidine1402-2'-O)-methyltransferase
MLTLYIIATPIGNLEDITYRAVRILAEVDTILAEDTRVSARLLARYSIKTPMISFHAQSSEGKRAKVLALIAEGKSLALISDAGTPTISDPGSKLVREVREWCAREERDVAVVPVPGASALTTALSAAGVPTDSFLFLGFLPHKRGRLTLFQEMAQSARTIVFYESPHRIIKTLESLALAVPERRVTLARELTKMYEEYIEGRASDLLTLMHEKPEKQKGEFVVIVSSSSL